MRRVLDRSAVGILSGAALAYEIVLVRMFSIALWHHFAAMVISLALLGVGASGTLLTLLRLDGHRPRGLRLGFSWGAVGFALSAIGCFAIVQRVHFNPLEIAWSRTEILDLMTIYVVLAVPFLATGTSIGLALTAAGREIPGVYRADLVGAGLGVVAAFIALFLVPATALLRAVAIAGVLAGLLAMPTLPTRKGNTALLLTTLGAGFLVAIVPGRWISAQASEYKGLPAALLIPEARKVSEINGPFGQLTVVESRKVPFRYAPGLSLRYKGEIPSQLALFVDGDRMVAVDQADGPFDYLDYSVNALPYALIEQPEVLIAGVGGGSEIRLALLQGAQSVDVSEPNPQVIRLLRRDLAAWTGGLLDQPKIRVAASDVRSLARRRQQQWDLIQVPLVETMASASAGNQSMSSNYLLTVEALEEMIEGLRPGGMIGFTQWLRLPPREELKIVRTAAAALRRKGVRNPEHHMAQIRSWATIATLIKVDPFGRRDIENLLAFCRDRSFDPTYFPGISVAHVNRFNRLQQPLLFESVTALLGPEGEQYARSYSFDLRPATDDRPFFDHFFRWQAVSELVALQRRTGAPLVEWGYLVGVACLLQAVVAAIVFIVMPLGALPYARQRGRVVTFFGCLGLAFMVLEVSMLQWSTVYLGNPVYAFVAILGAMLVLAGFGSGVARRWSLSGREVMTRLRWVFTVIVGLCLIAAVLLPDLLRGSYGFGLPARAAVVLTLLTPLAVCMGIPFPLGLSELARLSPGMLPWAWAINGAASVVGAVLAPVLAVQGGLSLVIALAAGLYLVAWLALVGILSPRGAASTARR